MVYGGFVPHPPLLVEGIGDEEKAEVAETDRAYRKFALGLKEASPTTVVVVTPHGPVFSDAYTMVSGESLEGDFAPFGSAVLMSWQNDSQYIRRAQTLAAASNLPLFPLAPKKTSYRCTNLDHGAMLPLWYLQGVGWSGKVVCIRIGGLSAVQCYEIGRILAQASGKDRVALVASGDMSHCLSEHAPSPYNPAGGQFDRLVVKALEEKDFTAILKIPLELRQRAAECGWRPLVTLLGALNGCPCQSEVLSYQGPFGVGYLVATFLPLSEGKGISPHAELAREAIRQYLTTGVIPVVTPIPPLKKRGAAFVSLKKEGQLRGCIGTIQPEQPSLAQEIAANAIAAATEDPRFEPVTLSELELLSISVDVLSEPVLADYSQLDPDKYGLIAQWGGRRGLLLPDLPGVETPREQLEIVCKKAGIPSDKSRAAKLYIFTVERFF